MSTVTRVLVLTCSLLLVTSAWGRRGGSSGSSWGRARSGRSDGYRSGSSHVYPYAYWANIWAHRNICQPDINYNHAYRIEHPICSRLAANRATGSPFTPSKKWYCGWTQYGTAQNITLYWDSDISRAASTLLAAQLRHLKDFQHVHLTPNRTLLSDRQRRDELVIALAAVIPGAEIGANYSDGGNGTRMLKVYSSSHVPTRCRLHAWLTPAARSNSACRHTDWSSHTDLTVLALCGFIDPVDKSYDLIIGVVDVLGVGDDCKSTMQRLLQRAEAAGSPARAIYVNRTVFEQEQKNAKYSFLFLDFDIWGGEPSVGVVEPPPCVSDAGGICEPELDDSTAMLVAEHDNLKKNTELINVEVQRFKPTPESLRVILDREANGVNIEEAACDWLDNNRNFSEMYSNFTHPSIDRYNVLAIICVSDSDLNIAYDSIIRVIKVQLFTENYDWYKHLNFRRYYTVCSDTSNRINSIFDIPNLMGVVWVGVEGARAASRTAAERRVPLLLAAPVPDVLATGDTTWWVGGRLRHIALALQHLVGDYPKVAVLSEPTTYARHYLSALEDVKFDLDNFKLPRNLTQTFAQDVLRDVQATKARVVIVNTNADTADLILAAAVELNMSHTDGFIWTVRELRKEEVECSTKYLTVSLENVELLRSNIWKLGVGDEVEMEKKLPPYMVPLADALLTIYKGFKDIFLRQFSELTNLHNDQAIREFDESLREKPVASFNGTQLIYKKRAIEEALVYVDSWCGVTNKRERMAEWLVNATSGSVRDAKTFNFNNTVRSDANSDGADSAGGLNITDGSGDVDSDSTGGFNGTDSPMNIDSDTIEVLNATGIPGNLDSASVSDGTKDIKITTDKPANTSNFVFWVHQWIESITKIESPRSDLPVFDLLNLKKFFQSSNTNILNMTTETH